MDYYSIIAAIPEDWRLRLRNYNTNEPMQSWDLYLDLCETDHFSQQAYWAFVNKISFDNKPTKLRWEMELNCRFEIEEWENLCTRMKHITGITNFRLFQYKILQKALVTNIKLNIYKIKDSTSCTFCSQHPESLIHLFWECELVQNLWVQLIKFLKENLNEIELHLMQKIHS